MPTDPLPDWVPARRRVIGDRIRAARVAAHLTQEAVAGRSGLDRKTVNRLEQGHTSPLLDHLLLVADAIGVPAADLMRE
ncbi:helix-turn-helix domain-containing protein [Streptomyces sp. NBC_00385]|uniref:helix-turn-helix domain-containing protein n=1 Tax=Streptomyces sp. NBC_00385 TaxID=2975733 RepID=UPI002DD9C4E3|nr:helix-turn-helix transcriptional regulator [Streptomyces sp. NBC_00385]WRZ05101.1 helix-turn-helix domain-containing protein [Streptomyces sp. NBC_00385]